MARISKTVASHRFQKQYFWKLKRDLASFHYCSVGDFENLDSKIIDGFEFFVNKKLLFKGKLTCSIFDFCFIEHIRGEAGGGWQQKDTM